MNRTGDPISLADYEALAAERLDAGPHAYFAGGAGDERTLRANAGAYGRSRLRPRAVLVGRPALWGLAVNGEDGAREVLELLRAELELALTLLGCPTPAHVRPEHVAPVPRLGVDG